MLTAAECDVLLDFDHLMKAGSALGSAGVMVMDSSTCMVKALERITHFYAHESCGQCTPCREGTPWMERLLIRIEKGQGRQRRHRFAEERRRQHRRQHDLCPR